MPACTRSLLLAGLLVAGAALGQSAPNAAYTEIFYRSGELNLQAYLYRPHGDGPFPVVIYNHGSRDGRERESAPFPHIGALLTRAGYVALVPERRGYGKSDGQTWREETRGNQAAVVARLEAETDDVLAAIDWLKTQPAADIKRVGIMGWSFGGVVTMMAIARSAAFSAAVDQAGGALTWDYNGYMRSALTAAAEKARTPTLFLVASNDRTTASVSTLADLFKTRGVEHRLIVYDAFVPRSGGVGGAPGHTLFSSQGVTVWEKDVVEFLDRHLKR